MKAAICIGVDKTGGGLTPLQAGKAGAIEFANWADAQGFNVTRILDTDEPAPGQEVTAKQIKDAVKHVLRQPCEQLVIFFSGHGSLSGQGTEAWLLSGAPDDPDEAVNLTASIHNARNSGVPHVVFISDACRSVATTTIMQGVLGSSIFPNQVRTPRGDIDRFFAAQPGQPALELKDLVEGEQYNAVFTERLMYALNGNAPDVIFGRTAQPSHVVPPRPLKHWLFKTVPKAATAVDIKLKQKPDAIIESDITMAPGHYLAALTPLPPTLGLGSGGAAIDAPPLALRSRSELASNLPDIHPYMKGGGVSLAERQAQNMGIWEDAEAIAVARGRARYETRVGFSIVGAEIRNAYVATPHLVQVLDKAELDTTKGHGSHIRLHLRSLWEPSQKGDGATALIELEDGTGICLAALGGLLGTIVVRDGAILTINYTPDLATDEAAEFERKRSSIEARRALVAAAASDGAFRLDRKDAGQAGDFLRRFKASDPTLGVYASYAYVQAGLFEEAESVLQWMRKERPGVMPFDIVMLGRSAWESTQPTEFDAVAPCCPMLTQGWSLLESYGVTLPKPVIEARRHILPSLWTRFDPAGVAILKAALENGDIK